MWQNDPTFLFPIRSQTSPADRHWLMRLCSHTRDRFPRYRYLEVGSYLGGTLTQALLDERCVRALSIDQRGGVNPDVRGALFDYRQVTTDMMVEGLRAVPGIDLSKLVTYDGSASACDFGAEPYELALIDAEHTNEAVFADFLAIYPHLARNAAVAFHDSNLLTSGLENINTFLKFAGRRAWFGVLAPSIVSVLFLDRDVQDIPAEFLEKAVNWKEFKAMSQDALLLEMINNRVTFNVKLKSVPVRDPAQI